MLIFIMSKTSKKENQADNTGLSIPKQPDYNSILWINEEDLLNLGADDFKVANQLVEKAYVDYDLGATVTPPKMVIRQGSEKHRTGVNVLGSYYQGYYGYKLIGSNPGNVHIGLLRGNGLSVLFHDAIPVSVMEATLLSAMRTGASGGVAAKYLAPKTVERIGIVGTGVQAQTQIGSLKESIGLEETEVGFYSRNPKKRKNFSDFVEKLGLLPKEGKSIRDAVSGSEIVITATSAYEPLIRQEFLKEGCLYIHIGGYEDHPNVAKNSRIVCDSINKTLERGSQTVALMYWGEEYSSKFCKPRPHEFENPDFKLNIEDFYCNIAQIIRGQKGGRNLYPDTQFYFNPVGLPAADVALMVHYYNDALDKGVGTPLKTKSGKMPFGTYL
jgi:ornithine cyclodeaminase/alanine dehydrogenase-like protein (mu-crystallin family)